MGYINDKDVQFFASESRDPIISVIFTVHREELFKIITKSPGYYSTCLPLMG
jgi:hypothetical protein